MRVIKVFVILFLGWVLAIVTPTELAAIINGSIDLFFFKLGMVEFFLSLLMIWIGIDLGLMDNLKSKLKQLSPIFIWFTILNIGVSLLSGLMVAYFIGIPIIQGLALNSGLGWYSFTSSYLSQFNPSLGALAFIANVLRELIPILILPLLPQSFPLYVAMGIPGSPSMDTNLPLLVQKYRHLPMAPIYIILNGVILSFAGAFLVALFSLWLG